jgi:hypothetical protein
MVLGKQSLYALRIERMAHYTAWAKCKVIVCNEKVGGTYNYRTVLSVKGTRRRYEFYLSK